MNGFDEAKRRLRLVREGMERATVALTADDLPAVVQLCRESLDSIEGFPVAFSPDHLAVDLIAAQLAVAKAWAKRKGLEVPVYLDKVMARALDLRMRWLEE